jgi:hypothetical protein
MHNLIAGKIRSQPEPSRATPYHPAHSTAVAGLTNIAGGDDRFYNNIFVGPAPDAVAARGSATNHAGASGYGLWVYDARPFPLQTGGNVYYKGAGRYAKEEHAVNAAGVDPKLLVDKESDAVDLELTLGEELRKADTKPITTELLGKAKIPGLGYENADGSPVIIATDYFGKRRSETKPTPGPFEGPGLKALKLKVW